MSTITIRLASLALALASTGCGEILDDDGHLLRFAGTVRSAVNGQPISGAVVSLERGVFVFQGAVKADTTDQSGQYRIEFAANCTENTDLYQAPGNAYLIVARANGYGGRSNINMSAPIYCARAVQNLDFNLDPR